MFMQNSIQIVPSIAEIACLFVKNHGSPPVVIELALKTIARPKQTSRNVKNSSKKSGVPLRGGVIASPLFGQ
jgi:hypothetical protein